MRDEQNQFRHRAQRYAKISANIGTLAVKYASKYASGRLSGRDFAHDRFAEEITNVVGELRGPLVKLTQILASIPEALPPQYADSLRQLQANAPPMGRPFVQRRMQAELGAKWRDKYSEFDLQAAAAASLGQVHYATDKKNRKLAVKLQYPNMESAVEADLGQLKLILGIVARFDNALDTSAIPQELAARLREELDYRLEARHMRFYQSMLQTKTAIKIPSVINSLSTGRLLTMTRLDGQPILQFRDHPPLIRNAIAKNLFDAWWLPFIRYGVIHADPHLGNYTVREEQSEDGTPVILNLLDFGCIRIFPPRFIRGVLDLYQALKRNDHELCGVAYKNWGFENLNTELITTLNIWARFIYGPLLDDRVRTIADGVSPGAYGRKEIYAVHQRLRKIGPVKFPGAFVFMDRAAIGLGAAFLHLNAQQNWHRLFEQTIEDQDFSALEQRQSKTLARFGISSY